MNFYNSVFITHFTGCIPVIMFCVLLPTLLYIWPQLLLISSLSVLLLFDNFYMGTKEAAKLERWDLTSKDPLLL